MDDIDDQEKLPPPLGPVALLMRLGGDRWAYRWWDDPHGWLRGDPPDRVKVTMSLQQCLPMLLSDHSRATLSADFRGSG